MPPSNVTATERLYWNADKTKLVPQGHKEAASLYAAPGHRIPASMVERFGLKDGKLPASAKAAASKPVEKSGQGGGNKQGGKGGNKQGQKGDNKGTTKPGLTVKKAAAES